MLFDHDWINKFNAIYNNVPADWMLLYLGATQYKWNKTTIKNGYYQALDAKGSFAYAVDSEMYADLLDIIHRHDRPIDECLLQMQKKSQQ